MKEIVKIIAAYDALAPDLPLALVTLVSVEQSSYRRVGARMLVAADGTHVGGISGGCLEGDALRRAARAIHDGRPSLVTYDTREGDDRQIGVGLGCNGRINVLFVPLDRSDPNNSVEVLRSLLGRRHPTRLVQAVAQDQPDRFRSRHLSDTVPELAIGRLSENIPPPLSAFAGKTAVYSGKTASGRSLQLIVETVRPTQRLVVCGDNYDVRPFYRLCHELGWELLLYGNARKYDREALTFAKSIHPATALPELEVDSHTAVLLMSHDYDKDKRALTVLPPPADYFLGVLGPRKRSRKLCDEVGIDLSDLHAPIGLDIGAETPEEIAFSIISEVIAYQRGRPGTPLRRRAGTIYGDAG